MIKKKHYFWLIFIFFQVLSLFLVQSALAKEIDSKQDLQEEESASLPAEHRSFLKTHKGGNKGPPVNPTQEVTTGKEAWPLGRPDVAQIKALNVKCEKSLMKVNIEFDRPFNGLVFSKGHYSDPKCVHLPAGSGQLQANFEIFLGGCGMSSSDQSGQTTAGPPTAGLFIENTIIIQYDRQVQEIWDQARRLRCTWYDYYEKSVTFRPFNVDMLDAVTANFLGDNIQCWMQIQVGKGPWASEVAGIVKIGQTMTMVLAIKDDENKFDMLVRNCIAHDGKHQPIQLVDEYGCIVRPKIMSRFQKVKNFGHSATVVSYAYFQAFKFPDSMNVHFQCVIQVCRFECPEPACEGDPTGEYLPAPREPAADSSDHRPIYQAQVKSPPHPISNRPPPPIGLHKVSTQAQSPAISSNNNNKILVNRKGEIAPTSTSTTRSPLRHNISGYAISNTGGMPRALKLDIMTRKRRQTLEEVKDIKLTQKIIQVVAPGDMAFTLPLAYENGSAIVDNIFASRLDLSDNSICMSMAGFTAGLVFLLLILILSSIVTAFLFIKLRQISSVGMKFTESIMSYDNMSTDFLKIPGVPTVHISTCS